MTRIDQIIADALAGSPETHVAILAREVVRLREVPAVVVPEYPQVLVRQSVGHTERHAGILEGVEWARRNARAIPAHRVLGEGMVGVDREDCALAVEWCHAVQDLNPGYLEVKDRAACERFNALRANQGGADHD